MKRWATAAEYASHRGLSRKRVYELINSGVIVRTKTGKIDVARSDKAMSEKVQARVPLREQIAGRATSGKAVGASATGGVDYARERAYRERAVRRKLELEVAERRGELVRSEAVALHVAGIFSTVQQRLRAMPANLAGRLAAVTGQGQHEAREILRAGIDEVLEDAAAALERDAQ